MPAATDSLQTAVQDTARAVAQATPPAVTETSTNLWEMILKGGPVMIPLAIFLLVAVYIIIERLIVINRSLRVPHNFMNNIRDFILSGNIDSARAVCKTTNAPVARMIEKGINRIGRPLADIEKSIENVGKLEVAKLEKNLNLLGIIAGIAPMMGFIGTILGVIRIFYNIGLAGTIEVKYVADGLYEKMVSSASGLIIGIIAYAAYHLLSGMIDKAIFKMESNTVDFIDVLQEPSK
jgi:biopolymer transport protein ExbB